MTLGKRTHSTLLERAADRTTDAVETAVEMTQEFLENTARPALQDAAAKTAPIVAAGAGMAADRAAQAKEYAEAKSTELTGHPKKKHRGRKFLLFALIRKSAATQVTSLLYLTPPTTAVMARVMFREAFSIVGIAGMLLAVIGVALVTRK